MNEFLADVRELIAPGKDDKHGPLAPLLLGLTVVTGVVDAFSYLTLGHVFVANMTGNVVFLALALGGARGFSALASLNALAAFSVGAVVGGRLSTLLGHHRGRLLAVVSALEALLLGVSAVVVTVAHGPGSGSVRYPLITVLGLSMGAQNAMARKLAVPDLTTSVLTMTLTGLSADSRVAGGGSSRAGRRLVAALAMFIGALVGALFVLKVSRVGAVLLAAAVLAVIAVITTVLSRSAGNSWAQAPT
jgi:uncharacterized membrane protein YoaK (UPF0700 family)